jgi:hypothetical protein
MKTRIVVTARTADFIASAGDNVCRGGTPIEALGNLVRNYGRALGVTVEMPADEQVQKTLAARAGAQVSPCR